MLQNRQADIGILSFNLRIESLVIESKPGCTRPTTDADLEGVSISELRVLLLRVKKLQAGRTEKHIECFNLRIESLVIESPLARCVPLHSRCPV